MFKNKWIFKTIVYVMIFAMLLSSLSFAVQLLF
jgi:hypothetical protein